MKFLGRERGRPQRMREEPEWAVAPLFAAAILLGVLFFFAHRAGRRAVNDLDFKLEHPPSAAVQVVAPPPTADVELVAP